MEERFAFVTAGGKGLGQAIVKGLLTAGWHVAFTYHTSEALAAKVVDDAASLHRRALAIHADLLKQSDVESAIAKCLMEFGRIDALVHNFGPFVFERLPLAEYSDELWQQMQNGNLSNLFWMYRKVVPGMRERAFGRIVTVGYDGAGFARGWRYRAAYAAAKAGLASLTRSIAREERQNGITANMVCPGDIRGQDKMRTISEVRLPENTSARPAVGEDVSRMVALLCGVDSQQLNGTVTEITGGYDVLAYDDGQDVVFEPAVFVVGQRVFVTAWATPGIVIAVSKTANRSRVYEVDAGTKKGQFTAFQLKSM